MGSSLSVILLNLLMWYENSGKPKSTKWRRHDIATTIARPYHGQAIDMDNDGDLDIVMAFGSVTKTKPKVPNQVSWFENRLKQKQGFRKHFVCNLVFATEAAAADFDNDGDLDIAACAWGAKQGKVIWAENLGLTKSSWKVHTLKQHWPKACSLIAADFNNDKRIDILASAERGSNEVRLWLNLAK